MPELPEVQTIVDGLVTLRLVGRTICSAQVLRPQTIALSTVRAFTSGMRSQTVIGVSRRAKYIVIALAGGQTLLIHLRMTGKLFFQPAGYRAGTHDRVIFCLDDGRQLHFNDTRAFGRVWLLDDARRVLGELGPEPLDPDFRPHQLSQRLHGRHRHLKPLLLDQTFIAGLGNIYVDEALWLARLHPLRQSDTLKPVEVCRLHDAIRTVLLTGLANGGTTLGSGQANFYSVARRRGTNSTHLNVFRRDGEPCPRCRQRLVRIVVAQRSTHLCEQCQIAPD